MLNISVVVYTIVDPCNGIIIDPNTYYAAKKKKKLFIIYIITNIIRQSSVSFDLSEEGHLDTVLELSIFLWS